MGGEMEETTTTTVTDNPDGTKTTTTKVIRKTPTRPKNERDDDPATARNADGTPVDGGTHPGDPPGSAVCCLPMLCEIL